jgi:hypothetical protein
MNIQEKLMHIQQEIKATKDLRNDFGRFNYRNAENIFEAAKPLCAKYKVVLKVSDDLEEKCGHPYIKAVAELYDTESQEGQWVMGSVAYARIPDGKKGMDDSQICGSASSYARKYALGGLFCLDDNKDPDSMDNSKEGTNQNKLDEMENWRMTNSGIEIKGNSGFVPISTMSKELLQACLNLKRFADVRQYIEAEIKKK